MMRELTAQEAAEELERLERINEEINRTVSEHSCYVNEQGGIAFDGYGGEFGQIHIEINKAKGELCEEDVKYLHDYLTAWFKARKETEIRRADT